MGGKGRRQVCKKFLGGRYFFDKAQQCYCRETCPRAPCAAAVAQRPFATAARAELCQKYDEWCRACDEGEEEGELKEGEAATSGAAGGETGEAATAEVMAEMTEAAGAMEASSTEGAGTGAGAGVVEGTGEEERMAE